MSVKDDLIAAKALIDTPEKWVKRVFNRGHSYCISGALSECNAGLAGRRAIVDAMGIPSGSHSMKWLEGRIYLFNDAKGTTHADVMAVFDRAIKAAQ